MKDNIFMKQVLLLVMLMFLPLIACAQTRLLTNFPSGMYINKTYVSQYMIEKNKNYFYDSHGCGIKGLEGINMKNLTGIEVYNCKNLHVFDAIGVAIKGLLEKYKAKPLIMSEEGKLISGIYILYENNESIGIAIIDSNIEAINITILHGRVE